jgi:hypothetical protein
MPKWRDVDDHDVDWMVGLILKESLSIWATSFDKTTEGWRMFWEDSRDVHARTAALGDGSISFLKAATLIKFLLFSQATVFALRHSIAIRTMPMIRDRLGRLNVSASVILDNEIQGEDNHDAFAEIWQAMNEHQPKLNSLGVVHKVTTVTLATESQEPLLLLPDYVAGILQAVNSTADTLVKSRVSALAANRAFERLKAASKFCEFPGFMPKSYFEIFPNFKQYARHRAP